MASISEILADRTAAGERYAEAVEELRQAFIDLAAHDRVFANARVFEGEDIPGSSDLHYHAKLSFTGDPNALKAGLRHPEFMSNEVGGDWAEEISTRFNEITSS
jgi:hypothetical protein